MREDHESGALHRRRFLTLSGAAAASAVLTTTARNQAAAQPRLPAGPEPDPTTCGKTTDTDRNWLAAQACVPGQGSCLQKGPNSVVLKGTVSHQPNFITVPTKRINGIECPWVAESNRPNYWQDAWDWTQKAATKVNGPVGLGINSKNARDSNQLHIHMATVRHYSQQTLSAVDSAIASSFNMWKNNPPVKITGWNSQGAHQSDHLYRVVHVSSFSTVNLFEELRKMVGQANMYLQTLIVIPRPAGGFYIANSELKLSDGKTTGSDTCDPLLLIQKG